MTLTRRSSILAMLAGLFGARAFAQQHELIIKVNLPLDRAETGTLSVSTTSGQLLLSDVDVVGKSDNQRAAAEGNPTRQPTLPYGDTPEGEYAVPRAISTGDGTVYSQHSYGGAGALVLDPIGGEALTAKQNGRTGLLIHSGAMRDGKLRVTHGCLRVSEANMREIFEVIRRAGDNPVFNRCEVVKTSVIVGNPMSEGAGDDESDPPPGIDAILDPGDVILP